MADTTNIEWCDSTFNPWIGCTRISTACDDCYAARSTPARTLGVAWGSGQPRRRTSDSTWGQPVAWQRQAPAFYAVHGRRRRVFCASLADWLDNEVPIDWLVDLLQVVHDTPALDWLLLTKRIGNWERRISEALHHVGQRRGCLVDPLFHMLTRWLRGTPPLNVWIGATVVIQPEFDRDMPKLDATPAAVRFLSIEPMLGAIVDRDGWLWGTGSRNGIDWVICGGESGSKARPMHPDWARSLRDQCAAAGVPFMFKQWGAWREADDSGLPGVRTIVDGDPEWDSQAAKCDAFMARDGELILDLEEARSDVGYRGLERIGKRTAGRLLDGREHNGFPAASYSAPAASLSE